MKEFNEQGLHLVPMVTVNGQVFRGQLNPDNVFEAICGGFTHMPRECEQWLSKEGLLLQVNPDFADNFSTQSLVIVVAVLLAFNFFLFLMYRNYL